jgi:Tir chaperone protein (CesT) family
MDVAEAREIANAALAGLAPDAGEELGLDEEGVCRLVFDGGGNVYVVLDAASADLIVWSPAGFVPREERATALPTLMQANLFWGGTNGATLALAPDGETVILQRRVPLHGLKSEELGGAIEHTLHDATSFNEALAVSAVLPEEPGATAPERPNQNAIRG